MLNFFSIHLRNKGLGFLGFLMTFFVISCQNQQLMPVDSPYPMSDDQFSSDTLVRGFKIPFGLAILNDNEYLITDRVGILYHFKNGVLAEIKGLPTVQTFGDPGLPFIINGGLMDISLHPSYPQIPWVYVAYFSESSRLKLIRFKFENENITEIEPLFETRTSGYYGNGTIIAWQDDKHLFLTIGNSNISTVSNPLLVSQDLKEDWGKIHRLMDDGSIPTDNPILEGYSEPISIWSYGHRDAQGLVYDQDTQTLFAAEHGPKGGDEFNIIQKGGNYGWPLFTYGIDYSGVPVSMISKDSAATFTILPEHYWTVPTNDGGRAIAPSSLLLVKNSSIPAWNDRFLVPSLAFRRLLKFNRETGITEGLPITGRIRTLKQLPSGDILALIEKDNINNSNGYILRIGKSN